MIKPKSIYLAVLNQGSIRPELVLLLDELKDQQKYNLFISFPSNKPISYNRNKIVQHFLSLKEFDYLIMIDSDIVPPPNVLNLVDLDKDIITPLLFAYQDSKVLPLSVKRREIDGFYTPYDPFHRFGLEEIDGSGTGCMIIRRDVLEQIKRPFVNEYDPDGMKKVGLDFAFCRRAKEEGYHVWCHFGYRCSHFTPVDLKEIYEALTTNN